MMYACMHACVEVQSACVALGGLGNAPRKFLKIKSCKIKYGDNFNPIIMAFAKNAHYGISSVYRHW